MFHTIYNANYTIFHQGNLINNISFQIMVNNLFSLNKKLKNFFADKH